MKKLDVASLAVSSFDTAPDLAQSHDWTSCVPECGPVFTIPATDTQTGDIYC